MMRTPLFVVFALVASAPALRADRFYFGSEAEDKKFVGQEGFDARSTLAGVLLREQDGMYVIRVEGGEVWVERTRVYRIEKDDLTVAQISERERKAQTDLAAARARRLTQVAEAAAQRSDAPKAADEAGAKALTLEVDFAGILPGYKFQADSDVLRRVDLTKLSREIEDWLRANGVEPARGAERDFTVNVDFKGLLPSYGFKIYDPIIHRVDLRGLARQVEDYLRAEVEAAANRGKRKITAN